MQNSPLDDLAKKIKISSSSSFHLTYSYLSCSRNSYFLNKQELTNLFQGICVKLEGPTYRLLLITGDYFDKNNLRGLCNLLCGLWQLVLVWPCSTQCFSCSENTFEWNSWKAIWQNRPVWIWFISGQPSGFPRALVDIHKLMFSRCSFAARSETTAVFLPYSVWGKYP